MQNFLKINSKVVAATCHLSKATQTYWNKETALAPLDYIDVEVTAFPKGHVAMATSWSNPESECALHTRFGDKNYRGPVQYQLDLDYPEEELRYAANWA